MDKIKVIIGILIVIAVIGLPCWVCWQKEIPGWLHQIYGGQEHEKNCISQ